MKKSLKSLLLLAFLMVSAVACKYDDGELWNKVNSLDDRLTSIETQLSQMNSDISSLSTVVNALQNKVYVASVDEVENGYQITFTDGKKVTITNGKDGADAPVISVDEYEGKYYWVQIIGEARSWLTDKNGAKIPVTGDDGITPILKVNTEGYWVISYDRGITFALLLDETNNPVKAVGKDGSDGKDGVNGSNGSDGDSFFNDVRVENGELVLVLADGTELKLPLETTEELPEYIALTDNLGDFDYAILGLNGSGYFYEFQEGSTELPKRLTVYDGNNDLVQVVVNFNSEGLPVNILSEEFTVVLANHENNKVDAVIITKEGKSAILEDVELEDITWEEYKNYLAGASLSRAVSRSAIKWINAGVGALSCGLSIAAAPTGVGIALTAISCGGAIMSIADAAGWIETPDGVAIGSTVVGHYVNLGSCAGATNPAGVAACLAGLVGNVTAIADLIETLNNDDITLGEGALASGNGDIKITLTWDNYADIDLHCVDPSGYHIYYADKQSTTGGFLDYDNTEAYGPENIYFNPAPEGQYNVYLHYYAENNGVSSVNYKVVIFREGIGDTYTGTISGKGATVPISTFLVGSISNTRGTVPFRTIDWNKLPIKY